MKRGTHKQRPQQTAWLVMTVTVALTAAFASAQPQPAQPQELRMRDGSVLRVRSIDVTPNGLRCVDLGNNTIHIGWQFLAPRDAYELRTAVLDPATTPAAERLAFAQWCMQFDELGPQAVHQLELVLKADPTNQHADRALQRMGYVFRENKVWRTKDWDAHAATARPPATGTTPGSTPGATPGATPQPTPQPQPTPGERVRRGGPVKVALMVGQSVTWGEHEKFKCEPKKSFRSYLEDFFKARGFEVVNAGADFRVEGEAKLRPLNIAEFFEIPISTRFQGDVILTVTDLQNPSNRRDFSSQTTINRTDVESALDAALADLAERVGPRVATFCQ